MTGFDYIAKVFVYPILGAIICGFFLLVFYMVGGWIFFDGQLQTRYWVSNGIPWLFSLKYHMYYCTILTYWCVIFLTCRINNFLLLDENSSDSSSYGTGFTERGRGNSAFFFYLGIFTTLIYLVYAFIKAFKGYETGMFDVICCSAMVIFYVISLYCFAIMTLFDQLNISLLFFFEKATNSLISIFYLIVVTWVMVTLSILIYYIYITP